MKTLLIGLILSFTSMFSFAGDVSDKFEIKLVEQNKTNFVISMKNKDIGLPIFAKCKVYTEDLTPNPDNKNIGIMVCDLEVEDYKK